MHNNSSSATSSAIMDNDVNSRSPQEVFKSNTWAIIDDIKSILDSTTTRSVFDFVKSELLCYIATELSRIHV